MKIEAEKAIRHYGILRKSGRYPWGSGDTPYQRSLSFQAYVKELKDAGMTEAEIARGVGEFDPTSTDTYSVAKLRATTSLAKQAKMREEESTARRLKDKGMSNTAIAKQMDKPESTIRALLEPSRQSREDVTTSVSALLKKKANEHTYVDVGLGTETMLGISKEKLKTSLAVLEAEGYQVREISVEQVTQSGKYTSILVLTPPGVTMEELNKNRAQITPLIAQTEDGGRTFEVTKPPVSLNSARVAVRYAKDGGSDMDGVIELRRGVADISLGGKNYAQVRIAVDGTHYLKGMAVYADDLPKGVDIRFNTNKDDTGNKLDALKPLATENKDYPFGAIVRNKFYIDKDGKRQQSVINTVGSKDGAGEEGAWDNYRRSLSSQMLSKQSSILAREQLDLSYSRNKAEYDNIMKLTDGYGCDTYIEATGHPSSVTQGMAMIRKLGRFVEFSVFGAPTTLDWSIIGDRKELDIRGAHLSPYTYPVAIDLLERGLVTSKGIVTHSYKLSDWEAAFECAHSVESIKVLLVPEGK